MVVERRQGLRRDAARNRERLLGAARQVFAERGHDVPLAEVATAAGISRTTIYRNFATREELVAAAYENNVSRIEACAEEMADRPDAAVVLFDVVLDMQFETPSLAQALTGEELVWLAGLGRRVLAVFERALEVGRTSGGVPNELAAEDMMLALRMGAGAVLDLSVPARGDVRERVRVLLHRALFRSGS